MTPVIDARGLRKRFGTTVALDGLDLRVEPGEIAGFLGPNGAGKSTAIRVLLGLIHADGGTARVLGGDPWIDAVDLHRRIAYVPGEVSLWPRLTGGEAIDVIRRLRGDRDTGRRDDLIELFELDPTKRCRDYSKGNRQKVALVAALCADADLYILDEPTSGLDPLMERRFQRVARELADRGAAVLLSSHILGEVDELCDSVTIIRAGRTVEAGTLDSLRHLTRTRIAATLPAGVLPPSPPDGPAIPGIHRATLAPAAPGGHGPRLWTFDVERPALPGVLRLLAELRVTDVRCSPPSLEELFLEHYEAGSP